MSSNIRSQSVAGLSGATVTTFEYFLDVSMPDEQAVCASVVDLAAAASTVFTLPGGSQPVMITSVVMENQTALSAGATMTVRVGPSNIVVATVTPAAVTSGIVTNAIAAAATAVTLKPSQTISIVGSGTTPTGRVKVIVKGVVMPNM